MFLNRSDEKDEPGWLTDIVLSYRLDDWGFMSQ
jgi:hypothetical protein